MKELVTLSPFRTGGTVYLGRKTTTVLDVDVQSGEIVRSYSLDARGRTMSMPSPVQPIGNKDNESTSIVMSIGRIEYELTVYSEDDLVHPR